MRRIAAESDGWDQKKNKKKVLAKQINGARPLYSVFENWGTTHMERVLARKGWKRKNKRVKLTEGVEKHYTGIREFAKNRRGGEGGGGSQAMDSREGRGYSEQNRLLRLGLATEVKGDYKYGVVGGREGTLFLVFEWEGCRHWRMGVSGSARRNMQWAHSRSQKKTV